MVNKCPGGEIGIRNRLKICRSQGHVGSTPTPGTVIILYAKKRTLCKRCAL